jgi:DNA-damage-inducible protein D
MSSPPAQTVFHFDDDRPNFEAIGKQNGQRFWYALDLMKLLGYETWQSFSKVINRAIGACTSLDIKVQEGFEQVDREIDGKIVGDYKLNRFACYLIAMNGDPKKPEVAQAQVYFAALAATFKTHVEASDNVERLLVREEISEHESGLNKTAKMHGVEQYGLFQNAGYRGMYNMNLNDLKQRKGLPQELFQRSLLDFMGKTELAANLFRVTQTEAKIKNFNIKGQRELERAAEDVGKEVRSTIRKISGTVPEDLPLTDDIHQVRKTLKSTRKVLQDPKKKPPKRLPPTSAE